MKVVNKAIYMVMALLCLNLTISAQNITLKKSDITVKQAMDELKNKSGYSFVFSSMDVDTQHKISVWVENTDIAEAVKQILQGQNLNFEVDGKNIILRKATSPINAQKGQMRKITGTVSDSNLEPIIGANVSIKGGNTGTITDINGVFSLEIPEGSTLLFSYIGYISKEIPVNGKSVLTVSLQEDTQKLEEVVVTALGVRREEKALGYSVQKIGSDELSVTKGLDVTSGLNGKIAGVSINNSTEFGERPEITMRGEAPLIVIDGVAYANVTLNDLSSDDIEDMNFLKGATASALYGSRGRGGAIMITTKKAKEGGFKVNFSNNTMFSAGYLRIPKTQSTYSSGKYGEMEYDSGYVWGNIMDGHMERQWDPFSKSYQEMPLLPKGVNNIENFFESSLVTNTNINVSQSGKLGGFRASATQVHSKDQFPGTKMDKYILTGGGNIEYKNFKLDAAFSYKRETSPNLPIANYGNGNIFYNMLVWTGADYDVRDFKDYWLEKDVSQNWAHCMGWYDNPYFIANERIHSSKGDIFNFNATMSYEFTKGLSLLFRSGYDNYNNKAEKQEAIGSTWWANGYYEINTDFGSSFNNDLIVMADYTWKDFGINALGGLSSFYNEFTKMKSNTIGGLSIPSFYSLNSSVEKPNAEKEMKSKAVYSVYAKLGLSWRNSLFLDVTGRNDWSSTLAEGARSYFYPSVSGSILPTQFYNPISDILDMWKLRASWTVAKKDLDIYDLNVVYKTKMDLWGGMTGATYPEEVRNPNVKPETEHSFEVGTDLRFFGNRLGVDFTYFTRLRTNRLTKGAISLASGFKETLTNTEEDWRQKGFEITLSGKPIVNRNFSWEVKLNGGAWHWYYDKLDPTYSSQDPRKAVGTRTDAYFATQWERDLSGNMVHVAGLPKQDKYQSIYGNKDPDFVAGMTNSFRFKDFDMSFTIDGRFGGKMFSWTENAMWHSGAHRDSENGFRYDEVVNGNMNYTGQGVKVVSGALETDPYGGVISDTRVFAPNDVGISYSEYIMTLHATHSDVGEDIKDATFVKLREIAINYSLPQKWMNTIGLNKVRVGVVGNNLLMITKDFRFSDPDRGKENLNSPALRYVGFNINVDL